MGPSRITAISLFSRLVPLTAILLALTSSAIADSQPAHRYALVLGGAAELTDDGTIFDSSISVLASSLKRSGYQSTVLFDGGHSDTDKVVEMGFGKKSLLICSSIQIG
jgi:hypothetical protein